MPIIPSTIPTGTKGRGPTLARSLALAMKAENAIAATSGRNAMPVRIGEKPSVFCK